jgi:hypothetical protein
VAGATLTFKAPGDDEACGTATSYEAVSSDSPIGPSQFASATPLAGAPAPAEAGSAQTFQLPAHGRYVAVRAVDEEGNVGPLATFDTGPGAGGPGGGGPGKGGKGRGKGRRGAGKGGAPGLRPAPGSCANLQQGSRAADRLLGTAAGDRLLGRGGRDSLRGRGGGDCLNGGRGADVLLGGSGNDILRARDGSRDLVSCGGGRDQAIVDRRDRVRGCERLGHHR